MKEYPYAALSEQIGEQLGHGGVFLVAGREEKNPMNIGWCQLGRVWNIPVCTVLVRPSRYSHELLERDRVFTVCVPAPGAMKKELGFCGSRSGRNVDKKKELGLTTFPACAGGVDPLAGCAIYIECEVIFSLEMAGKAELLSEPLRTQFYNPAEQAGEDGDPHTVYYARILAAYRAEE